MEGWRDGWRSEGNGWMCCCVGLIGLEGWVGCNGLEKSFQARDGMRYHIANGWMRFDMFLCCNGWMDGVGISPLLQWMDGWMDG